MRIHPVVVPIAALTLALGSFSAEAAQDGERGSRGSQSQSQGRSRGDASAQTRDQGNRGRDSSARNAQRSDRRGSGSQAQGASRQRLGEEAEGASRQREGDQAQGASRPREDARAQPRGAQNSRGGVSAERSAQRYQGDSGRNQRGDNRYSQDQGRGGYSTGRNGGDSARGHSGDSTGRVYDRGRSLDRRGYGYSYSTPRYIPRGSPYLHYYGSGGHLSLYFGIGSGYRYGSLYSGRVYGYRGSGPGYGAYQYYGDVRLQVSPRDAAVYVDGYYAGIVDDFDGRFQRLTLEVGPHEIEIEAPGLDGQVFNVYVDPSRTIDVRADLLR